MKLQNKTTTRLGGYLMAAVSCGTLASTASAAIVTFSDSGSFTEGRLDDVSDQPISNITLPDSSFLKIDPGFSGAYLILSLNPDGGRFTGTGTIPTLYTTFAGISLLNLGDSIFANNDSPQYANYAVIVNSGTPQSDFVGDVSGYIGFITANGNKGWLDVAYNSATGLFQYNGGAVETAGGSLTAGQVPEPSTAVLSLGALAAGAFIRRRKQAA